MTTIERFDTSILERPDSGTGVGPTDNQDNPIALRLRAAGSSFFWAMQLLPHQRREAMYALYAFCREVDDIADGDATQALKDVLLSDWRSEIALLYAGRPHHAVTRALNEAVRLYRLPCRDFLAIIDGMEMDARTEIRAPTLDDLDLYCQRVAVSVGRSRCGSPEKRHGLASVSRPNSAAHCSSPTSFATSPKMRGGTGCTCRAKCCGRTAFTPPTPLGCWRNRLFPMFAVTWPCLPKNIIRQPRRPSRLAPAGQCGRPP
jgi:hypothetical protein